MEITTASNGNQPRPATQLAADSFGGSLDDLLQLAPAELAALYRAARVPRLADVAGDLRGRMLAVEKLTPPLSSLDPAGQNAGVVFDAVRVSAVPTPEFGSVFSLGGLLAAGGAGIWIKRSGRFVRS